MSLDLQILGAKQHLLPRCEVNHPPVAVSNRPHTPLGGLHRLPDCLPCCLLLLDEILQSWYLGRSYREVEGKDGLTPEYYLVR